MEVITIDKLPEAEKLAKDDLILINQGEVTKNVNLEKVNDFIHTGTMGSVNELIANETDARMQGDNDTLETSKEYTDEEITKNKLAVNEWLAPVKTVSQIPKTGLDKTRNYLIKVTADTAKSGVYQAVAGWTSAPNWVLYSDAVDFVDEQELKAAIDEHNTDTAAHEDIRADIQKINEDYVNEGDIENAVNAHNQNINSHIDIRNIIANHIGIPSWDSNNFILTFTAENGTTLKVDIPLESLSKDLDYDSLTKELVITKQDDSEIRVSVEDLIDVYEGSTGTHIQITVENNVIKATLLSGAITENELSNALLEKINNKIDVNMIGAPNGAAGLDAQAKVPLDQLPDVIAGDISGLVNQVEQNKGSIENLLGEIAKKYVKPAVGIPQSDFASAVQTTLNNAVTSATNGLIISNKKVGLDLFQNNLTFPIGSVVLAWQIRVSVNADETCIVYKHTDSCNPSLMVGTVYNIENKFIPLSGSWIASSHLKFVKNTMESVNSQYSALASASTAWLCKRVA